MKNWPDFKAWYIAKNPNAQYKMSETQYHVYAWDGPDYAECVLYRAPPYPIGVDEGDNATWLEDFEANYKSACNWAIGVRPYAFCTSDFEFAADGVFGVLSEWTDNHADLWLKIEEANLYLNGGTLFIYAGFVAGDYASMAIVDKDGVYYPAGTVLKEWVKKRYPKPDGTCELQTPYAGKPLINTYVRCRVTRADSSNRTVAMNLNLHRAI